MFKGVPAEGDGRGDEDEKDGGQDADGAKAKAQNSEKDHQAGEGLPGAISPGGLVKGAAGQEIIGSQRLKDHAGRARFRRQRRRVAVDVAEPQTTEVRTSATEVTDRADCDVNV